MGKLNNYLLKDYLAIFAVAMLLITFAFCIGAIYKAIDIMAKGFPVAIVGRFFLYNIPYSLSYSIPISALFSTLLLFGRLSSDSEISALKSGGLSLWQIASPIMLCSVFFVIICLINNSVIYPATTYSNRQLIQGMGVDDPVKLLEEGRFIRDFPGYAIYVGRKNNNRIRDLVMYEIDTETGRINKSIRAGSGILSTDKEKKILKIDLFEVRIEVENSSQVYPFFDKYPIRLDFEKLAGKEKITKKHKNMTLFELINQSRNADELWHWMDDHTRQLYRSGHLVEINQRICLSIAPFMFVLIAIPLGIKSHRKESSIGMLMSLAIMFVYYLFIIASDAVNGRPEWYPWLIPWIPIVLGQLGGFMLMRRAN